MRIFDEFLNVVDALNMARIPHVVCRGIADAIHGYPRFTKDIDLLIERQHVDAVKRACVPLGFDLDTDIVPFRSTDRTFREVYGLAKTEGAEIMVLDLLLIDDPSLAEWATRTAVEWRGRSLMVVSRKGLESMKRAAGRAIDLMDLRRLGFDD